MSGPEWDLNFFSWYLLERWELERRWEMWNIPPISAPLLMSPQGSEGSQPGLPHPGNPSQLTNPGILGIQEPFPADQENLFTPVMV